MGFTKKKKKTREIKSSTAFGHHSCVGDSIVTEKYTVNAFRSALIREDLLPAKHDDYHMMLRFLKSTKFDIEKAKRKWGGMLEWRKEFGVDTILEDFEYPERDQVLESCHTGFHGVDKEGRPVLINPPGKFDCERLKGVSRFNQYVRYQIQEYEKTFVLRFPACSIAANRHIDAFTSIIDLEGWGLKNFNNKHYRGLIIQLNKICSDNYPEAGWQMFVINASTGFRLLWSIYKYFMKDKTNAKFHVLGKKYRNKLLDAIDASELPEYLGGACTCADQGGCHMSDKGPWNDPIIKKMVLARRATPIKGGDSSAHKSGSVAEDAAFPSAMWNSPHSHFASLEEEANTIADKDQEDGEYARYSWRHMESVGKGEDTQLWYEFGTVSSSGL